MKSKNYKGIKMKCNVFEITDEQREILIKEFSNKMFPLINKHAKKIPLPALAAYLIHIAKELVCEWDCRDYYLTLGILTEMVQDDLQEVFERHANNAEKGE